MFYKRYELNRKDRVRRVLRYQREVIIIRISNKKTTQWRKEKYKGTNNDLQSIHIKLEIEYHEPH